MRKKKKSTPITYYGGKQMMVPHIVPIIDHTPHEVYNEPFFGGGAIFFAKKPSAIETINDTNGRVVNFYRVLRRRFPELKELVEESLVSRDHWRKATDIYKNPGKHNELELAWAFWFCTNYSFAGKPTGGLRYSNHQWFSVPNMMSRKKKGHLFQQDTNQRR